MPLLDDDSYRIECIDISEEDALMSRYASTIPVLRRLRDDAELSWPFDVAEARGFLQDLIN